MVLSLPPVPPELKSIAPHLQRADELSTSDPVISYWCAYYAAQQGIALKVKDSSARHFLYDLLGLLERMKTDLASNDAVHDEPASAAYIENFALRVFASADNEDRSGNVTKSTARKFLAAANFFEPLRIFNADNAAIDLTSIEEKIKYAKWKAADIAKAIREGRTPTPGPPASAAEPESSPAPPDVPLPDLNVVPPMTPPTSTTSLNSQPSPPSITRSNPPPPNLMNLPSVDQVNHLTPHLSDGFGTSQPLQSPGSWSTAATPGTPDFHHDDSASSPATSSSYSAPASGGQIHTAFVSGELEGEAEDESNAETTPPASAAKSVHFSPSVLGGLAAGIRGPGDSYINVQSIPVSPPAPPLNYEPSVRLTHLPPPSIPPVGLSSTASHSHPSAPTQVPGAATATVTMMPAELTPQVITRVQKHCRYAISALDYEDREQAVKELRSALRMLGG